MPHALQARLVSTLISSGLMLLSPTLLCASSSLGELSTTSLEFGDQRVGTRSSARQLQIKNVSANSMAVRLSLPGDFVQTNKCGKDLFPEEHCLLNVYFTPHLKRVFDGGLDEVRIYNRVLSSKEIQDLFTLGAHE